MSTRASHGPTQNYDRSSQNSWQSRPRLAAVVRLGILLIPALLAFGVTYLLARSIPPNALGLHRFVWWAVLGVLSIVIVVIADKVARRFLPLVALLQLSLVFPDRAPGRFKVALRSGTTKKLKAEVAGIAAAEDETVERSGSLGEVMLALVSKITRHDRLTRGHSERVRAYSAMLGNELKLSSDEMARLQWAALMHDAGKLSVPAEILNKEGKPDDEEWKTLQAHPAAGAPHLLPFAHWLGGWEAAATQHHERWDGKGYPDGLVGEEIHLAARIVSIADAYDVMTSARSYKKPMSAEFARGEIARGAGGQFDPVLARTFLSISVGKLRLAGSPLLSLANLPAAFQVPLGPAAAPVVTAVTAATTAAAVTIGAAVGIVPVPAPAPEVGLSVVETMTPTVLPTVLTIPTRAPLVTSTPVAIESPPPSLALVDDDSPVVEVTAGPSPTSTAVLEAAQAPLPTATAAPRATATAVPQPTAARSATATPRPTATLGPTARPQPTATQLPTATPVPSSTATPIPTATSVPTQPQRRPL